MVQHMLSVFINNYSLAGNDSQDYMHAACWPVKEYMPERICMQAQFLFHMHVLKKINYSCSLLTEWLLGPRTQSKTYKVRLTELFWYCSDWCLHPSPTKACDAFPWTALKVQVNPSWAQGIWKHPSLESCQAEAQPFCMCLFTVASNSATELKL